MGKEWYWAGKSSKRGSSTSSVSSSEGPESTQTPSGCMCAVFHFFDFHPFHFPTTLNQQQQHQQAPFNSTTCISQDHTTIPKGAEAPRNSLELEDGTSGVSSFSKEDNFKIPIKNIQQIKTTPCVGGNLNDCSSPGTKTPTLVARLMGLDLLPNGDSPSFSSTLSTPNINNVPNLRTKQYIQTKPRNSIDSSDITTRSLPETPRVSSSSSRRSDVDLHHHRLSLQINKENNNYLASVEDLDQLPRFSFSKFKNDENNSKSPSHYARQIVKQVKESVSRRVGQDITNSTTTLKTKDPIQTREEFRVLKKSPIQKSSLKLLPFEESNQGKHSIFSNQSSSSSCSPRLRFIDTKHNKPNTTTTSPHTPKEQNTHTKTTSPHQVVGDTQPQKELLGDQKILVPKCNNNKAKAITTTNEKISSRFKRQPQTSSDVIKNKQEETFIIRPTSPTRSANDIKTSKGKKTQPLSSNLLNNNVPNLLPAVKTHPSPPATKILQKQSQVSNTQEFKPQLSSCSRQRDYKQEATTTLATQETNTDDDEEEDNLNGGHVSTSSGGTSEYHTPEFQYITQILNRTISVLFTDQWFSPKHPLDPSIFHHLEHNPNNKDRNFTTKNQLGHRWNRKLLFDLVDDVLKEILKPKKSSESFLHGFYYNWSIGKLSEKVWEKVEEFPCAKCEVLEDIDDLIETQDMEKLKVESEEERERLVEEIEGKIFDTLVHETVIVMKWGQCFL